MKHILLLTVLLFSKVSLAAWWVPVLQCDNGAARIEVDLGERRNVQLVVEDENIRRYLTGRVLYGRLNNGLFKSSDFQGFTQQGGSYTCHSGSAPTFKVYREGRGLKVSSHQEAAEGCCWESDSIGRCMSKGSDVPYKYLGDWYFQDCRELQIP